MMTHNNTTPAQGVGLPGLGKTIQGLAGMVSVLALVGAIGIGMATGAEAAVITSQVGTPAATGTTGSGLDDTLTGGFTANSADMAWTHSYGAISDPILSVTLEIDLIDPEDPDRRLDLHAGTSTSGSFIGSAYGENHGSPGPWLGLGDSSDNLFTLDSSFYSDIADGEFDIFGKNEGMWKWGSNRALLTITTQDINPLQTGPLSTVPEPATLALFGLGLAGFGLARRRRSV